MFSFSDNHHRSVTSSFERVSPINRINQNRVSSPILTRSHSPSPLGSPLRTNTTQSPNYHSSPVNGIYRSNNSVSSPLHSPSASPVGISMINSFNNQSTSSVDTSSNVRGNNLRF